MKKKIIGIFICTLMMVSSIGVVGQTIGINQQIELLYEEPTPVEKVKEVPIPWQFWETDEDGIWDIVVLEKSVGESVAIVRDFVVLPEEIPLDDLNWEDTVDLEWMPIDDPEEPKVLQPGEEVEVFIPTAAGDNAVLVRYTTAWAETPDVIEAHFVNEAILESGRQDFFRWLINFDVHNSYDGWINNFELELYGKIEPDDVIDVYDPPGDPYKSASGIWYGGWGVTDKMQINDQPYGIEVVWIEPNRKYRVNYCEWIHFGLELRIQKKKDEVPIPWQFWETMQGGVVDIIGLPLEVQKPVAIARDVAWGYGEIPLEDLNYDLNMSWEPIDDPEEPKVLQPGEEVGLEIPVGPDDGAVFVRYTVAWAETPDVIEAHFINEAILETVNRSEIKGELSNFDVHNDYDEAVDNFELELYGIYPSDIVGWYYYPPLFWLDKPWGNTLYGGWGAPPMVRLLPDGSGVEIKWKDRSYPIYPCQWVHFGVQLKPGITGVTGRGHWTQLVILTGAVGWFTVYKSRDMQRNRAINTLFLQFLENHPNMFPILRQLLGL